MSLVGICAVGARASGVGKSEAALALAEMGYRSLALAEPLKRFLAQVLRVPRSALDGPSEARDALLPHLPCSARDLLVGLGAWVRARDPMALPLMLLREIGVGRVVVSDVRLEVEVRVVRLAGGHMLGISRPDVRSRDGGSLDVTDVGLAPEVADAVIDNAGTLEAFRERVREVVRGWELEQPDASLSVYDAPTRVEGTPRASGARA